MDKEKIYLDHASTTNLSGEVLSAMIPVMTNNYGDSSSDHSFGRESANLVNQASKVIAESINAQPNEIYYTSCGSEANSWAIVGIANAYRNRGNHIIVSKIEHPSVIEACKYLENNGFIVTYLDVDKNGFINFAEFMRAIKSNTILISIISASNEIGTIQNIKAISQTAHEKGIIFHTDACQLYGNMNIDVEDLGIDAMSISAHKIYGPMGVGALYVSSKIKIDPIIFGENQETTKRGGVVNVAGVVGFAKACEVAMRDMKTNNYKLRSLAEYFETKLTDTIENIRVYADTRQKLPHVLSVTFIGVDGESLATKLDLNGVAVSAQNSSLTNELTVSHVMKAIGLNNDDARATVRFSLGKNNSYEELDKAIAVIARSVRGIACFLINIWNENKKEKGR